MYVANPRAPPRIIGRKAVGAEEVFSRRLTASSPSSYFIPQSSGSKNTPK